MRAAIQAIVAALAIATTLSARSQQETEAPRQADVPLFAAHRDSDVPDAQAIARRVVSAEQARNLVDARMVIAVTVWNAKDNSSCLTAVGATTPPAAGKVARTPNTFHWAMSESRKGDEGPAACQRAFAAALQNLAQSDALTPKTLQADAEVTRDPAKPKFPKGERLPGIVSHRTAGLSDVGKQLIADKLGARWNQVLDHRKYSAHLMLMTGKTVEGTPYCFAEYGLVAKPPEGVTAKFPATTGARWRLAENKNVTTDCTRVVVESALENLRSGYPDMLDVFDPEDGMSYPPAAALKKQVAKFDADEAKARPKPRPASVSSTTRSTTSLRCTNECFNGSCIRTFENGRKERWQAPRVYNPFKQNWEWDTTTNACGG
ncbi:hypothetical protein H8N03_04875 [Ramlibacter sp. USB13]|uniref:Lipoprotein n=1 Tax=Ramlibacter cellulosilyticus TaxID=2764187 RepID=A0A923MMC6_9BURK|nr:hypothetical protein [Ramlibacter cellulosilyticus]MBC5782267.1 hypothetical protein [Ramlibacter cellulosilyticus]